MAKKVEIEEKEGESLPLARTTSLATPSSGGHPRNAPVESTIEAPYELPEGWKWIQLLDAFENKTNSKKKLPTNEYCENGRFAVIDQGQDFIGGYSNKTELVFDGELPVIVFGDHTKCIKYIDFAFIQGADGIKVLKPIKPVNERYFYYGLQSINFPDLGYRRHFPIFKNYLFPLPPTIEEQQRIVNRIESMFAKLDEAKEKAQNVVDSFETRKAAILHQAFTGTLTAKWRKENGVADDSWKIVKLEDIVKKEKYSLKAGPFGSALKKEFYIPYGYKIYGQEQVLNSDENYGDYFINEAKYKELESCKIAPNDILISLVGTVGKTLILSDNCKPGIINPRLIKLSLDLTLMLPQFFTYYFGSDYCKSKYMTVQHGTTMDVLNMGILKQLDYPCCSLPEQQEIVRILDTVLEKERTAKSAAEQVLEQINLLKKSILTRAFRGEL